MATNGFPGTGKLQEPVDRGDGREGLAGAGCHLYEGTGPVFPERFFQILYRNDLAITQACGVKCWDVMQSGAQ